MCQRTSLGVPKGLSVQEALSNAIFALWDSMEGKTYWGHPLELLLVHSSGGTTVPKQRPWAAHLGCALPEPTLLPQPFLHLQSCPAVLAGWLTPLASGGSWWCLHKAQAVKLHLDGNKPVCYLTRWLTHYITPRESKYFFCQNVCNKIHSHSFIGAEAEASMILISVGFCAPASAGNPRTYNAVLWRKLKLFFFKVTVNVIMPAAHRALH